jgi:phosphoglycerate dehydrogenase-like enzyme
MSPPFQVALGIELPTELIERVRQVSAHAKVWTAPELERDPNGYRDAEVALVTGWLAPERLNEARALRWVQTAGAGVDRLLSPELVARSELVITNGSGIHAQPIAEHVFGLLLAFTRNLHLAIARQPEQQWNSQPYRETLRTLRGKTLGILGLGAIGQRIAEIATAFDLRVIGLKRTPTHVRGVTEVYGPDQLLPFLEQSELLVNILPLTQATRGWIGKRELSALPRGAFFVNVGRGATVDTEALVEALRSGQLAGAGLDVTEPEPLPEGHALWTLPNVIITPHYSGGQPDRLGHIGELFIENLRRYVAGQPLLNVVDKQAGY